MPIALTRKLELFADLSEDDRTLLDRVVARPQVMKADESIIREGDTPSDVFLILEGLACRCKYLKGGEKQIMAYLIPGDFCDMNVFILNAMDHDIETMTPCRLVRIPRQDILEMSGRPAIARALWWTALVDEATLREWLVNLGQRDTVERIAHLVCELHLRMKSVGLTTDGEFDMPMTQVELGSTVGLTPVHVNRSIQAMRQRGLIEFRSGKMRISDVERLRNLCDFHSNYLHLTRGGKADSASMHQQQP